MKLYLVRHGASGDVDQLTPRGKEESAKNALALKAFHPEIITVYHSVKVRAKETAEIFHEVLCHHAPLIEREGLKPMDAPEPIAQEIAAMDENTMIVAHLPFLEKLTSLLLYGEERTLPFTFGASAVLCLLKESQEWKIVGMISNDCFDIQKAL